MEFLHRTWAEIDLNALIHNFNLFKALAHGTKLMAVVKANAYGHDARITAPVLDVLGTDMFAVSNIDEAFALRDLGITKPILVLGYTPAGMAASLSQNDIIQTVYSPEYARDLSACAVSCGVKVRIHIKLDTGMGRIGFDCRDSKLCGLSDAIKAAQLPGFLFEGVFTHFAVSDRSQAEEDGFTDAQYARFKAGVDGFKAAGLTPKLCHCCNSAGFCIDADKHFDICRLGIILYGLSPADGMELQKNLIPVMTLKSVVSMVKEIKPGDTVSYGRTFTAQKNMRIATVAAGYADGYPRVLSNKGSVLIHGRRAPIVGRVCMDQLLVDISHIENVRQGDEVILFGREIPAEELAEICGTINYEIVCGITSRVPRIAVNSGE